MFLETVFLFFHFILFLSSLISSYREALLNDSGVRPLVLLTSLDASWGDKSQPWALSREGPLRRKQYGSLGVSSWPASERSLSLTQAGEELPCLSSV